MATLRTVYVDPDVSGGAGNGSSWANAYSSLNAAEQAQDDTGDLVTRDEYIEFHCGHNGSAQTTADTTAVDVNGWTTNATHYILIKTETADRHTGRYCDGNNGTTARYRLAVSGAPFLISYVEDVRLDGLQIVKTASTADHQCVVQVTSFVGYANVWVSNCILKGSGNASYIETGLLNNDAHGTVRAWNTVIYGVSTYDSAFCCGVNNGGSIYLYSCTIIGGTYGIRTVGTTIVAKNCYVGGSRTEDYYRGSGTLVKTNCASEDQSADDTSGTDETATNCVAAAVAINTTNFTNVTAGSEDFSLPAGSALIGAGTDTSGDAAPLNFTTDIIGTTRS